MTLIRVNQLFSVLIICCLSVVLQSNYVDSAQGHFTNDFAVEIDGNMEVADLVAATHGFKLLRQVKSLGNVYQFIHDAIPKRSKRSAENVVSVLTKDPNVRWVEQLKVLTRQKRYIIHDKQMEFPIRQIDDKSIYRRINDDSGRLSSKDEISGFQSRSMEDVGFNDPFFKDQWYLINRGQTGGVSGYDINVLPVWKKGITGKGVVVTILDDGIDHTHPDLHQNYDPKASADLNDRSDTKNDPMPNGTDASNSHGTRCAGEVAAQANNSNCCVGVAFNAHIGGVRMLDGVVTDLLEAEAILFNNQYVDIYSASWGPTDDGKTMEGPHRYCKQALEEGATRGRKGKGSIYIWATGNGGLVGDDCSCDGYVSSIYTLSIGCISDAGLSTYFSEVCPSTLAVVFTGGSHDPPGDADYKTPKIKVVTTDLNGDCTLEFQGTSSAAPLAAGCMALVLEANDQLTWRDVQHIVVETAKIPNDKEDGWVKNGGGYHVNHHFGFGVLDCAKMVEAAQVWKNVQSQHICKVEAANNPAQIKFRTSLNQTLSSDGCQRDPSTAVDHLEHVQVHVVMEHQRRGDVSLILISPSGTQSNILKSRPLDSSNAGINFTFMTVHNWGENPKGQWTLMVKDNSKDSSKTSGQGQLVSWSLTFYGIRGPRENHKILSKNGEKETEGWSGKGKQSARYLNSEEIKRLMAEEEAVSESTQIQAKHRKLEEEKKELKQSHNRPSWKEYLDEKDFDYIKRLFRTENEMKKRNEDDDDDDVDERRGDESKRILSEDGNIGRRRNDESQTDVDVRLVEEIVEKMEELLKDDRESWQS